MKYINQFGFILLIQYIGIFINKFLCPFLPSTVLGMIILFILLSLKIIKIEKIKEFSEFLLMNLAFFFIPPSIQLIKSWSILSDNLWKIFLIVIVSTILTMITVGKSIDFIIKKGEKNDFSK